MSVAKLVLVFFGGLLVLGFMLIHPIGPALFLFAVTPFEGLFYIFFGFLGNLANLAPLLVFLVRPGAGGPVDAFLGTRVQRAAALMVLGMAVSFLIVVPERGPQAALKYASHIYLFLVAGILSRALGNPRHMRLAIKVYVVCMAAVTILSAADFYLSLNLFPAADALSIADASEEGPAHRWRLTGIGGQSSNRFALAILLPLSLSAGWLARSRSLSARVVPLFCTAVLSIGLLGTICRSAILGAAVGSLVIASTAMKIRLTNLIAAAVVGGLIAVAALTLASRIGVEEAIEGRFTGDLVTADASARSSHWLHGLRLFAESPIIGVGDGVTETAKVKTSSHATDPHNGYIRHLAWTGLLGFSLLMYFYYVMATTLVASSKGVPDEIAYWRPYFLGGFVAVSVMNLFVSYLVERFLFIIAAFAAGLERARRPAVAQHRGEIVSPFLQSQDSSSESAEPFSVPR
jgi:O-antigen ligase